MIWVMFSHQRIVFKMATAHSQNILAHRVVIRYLPTNNTKIMCRKCVTHLSKRITTLPYYHDWHRHSLQASFYSSVVISLGFRLHIHQGVQMSIFRQVRGNVKSTMTLVLSWWRHQMETFSALSYGHMGGMRLRTNFAAESRVVTWSCGDRSVSKETYCVAYNLTGVWRITF